MQATAAGPIHSQKPWQLAEYSASTVAVHYHCSGGNRVCSWMCADDCVCEGILERHVRCFRSGALAVLDGILCRFLLGAHIRAVDLVAVEGDAEARAIGQVDEAVLWQGLVREKTLWDADMRQ